jgi:glycosyltransferase involved in cell wall biosynthesis
MDPQPLVSILINNYNYAHFVTEAIESALAQTYRHIEIIVVDDGSIDDSREVIGRFGNLVRMVAKENGGQASAFNAGFAASKGEIICFLDSDDLFVADKVRLIAEIFERHPNVGWCFNQLRLFDGVDGGFHSPATGWKSGVLDARHDTVAGRPPFLATATSGLSFRRDTLAKILPMPEVIRITSDNYLKFVALGLKEGWMHSEELSLQRIHGNNAYTNRTIGKKRIVGQTGLLTGICLHEKFPALQPLGKIVFCQGLGLLWATGGIDPDCEQLVESFLGSFALPARSALRLRAACSSARAML